MAARFCSRLVSMIQIIPSYYKFLRTGHGSLFWRVRSNFLLFQPKKFDDDALAWPPFFRKGFSLDTPPECPQDWAHWNVTWKLLNPTEAVRQPNKTGCHCNQEIKVILLPCFGLFSLLCHLEHTQHALLKRITDFIHQVMFSKRRNL